MRHFVLIAHGWDLNETIDLSQYHNSRVILSRIPRCVYEPSETKHKAIIYTAKDTTDYYKKISKHLKKYGNDYCIFTSDSQNYNRVPNMLISMYPKTDELTEYFQIFDDYKLPINKTSDVTMIFTLQEILDRLESNFSLLVIACRPAIDQFQFQEISEDPKYKPIFNWIKEKGIETNEEGLVLACESFFDYYNPEGDEEEVKEKKDYQEEEDDEEEDEEDDEDDDKYYEDEDDD